MKTPQSKAVKTFGISCLAAGAAVLMSQSAMAQFVEDFESYSTGALETVASPPWNYETTGLASIEADAGNQYFTMIGDGDWRYYNRDTTVALDTVGTFSFSLYIAGETGLDHAIGLTEFDGADADWYSDFGSYIRVTDDTAGVADVVSIDARNGGSWVDDIAALSVGQWYNVRFDIDATSGSGVFDVYVDDVMAGAGGYGFRNAFVNPLDTVLVMGGLNIESNVRIDNITLTVPEPSSIALALLGVGGLFGLRRSRRS